MRVVRTYVTFDFRFNARFKEQNTKKCQVRLFIACKEFISGQVDTKQQQLQFL